MTIMATSFEKLISDWPPSVVEGKPNLTYPLKWDQAIVDGRVYVDQEFVRFFVTYEGQSVLCSFQTSGEEVSVKMARALKENRGRTVKSIRTIDVPED